MIANIVIMKAMNTVTLEISGNECTRVVIYLLRLGLARILLSGRMTRSVLSALRLMSEKRISTKLSNVMIIPLTLRMLL